MSWKDDQCDFCSCRWSTKVLMGCVHEHSGTVRFCPEHEHRLAGTDDKALICVPCIMDHSCQLSVVGAPVHRDLASTVTGPTREPT